MQCKIKKIIDRQLKGYIRSLDREYKLSRISPLLFCSIKEFVLREGKRIRPTLLVVGYLGFAQRPAPQLYRTALSIELLHDFMLVHDDIIDKSETRRGEPSMHKGFNNYLRKFTGIKFNGQDLAIVVGDVMYAMAIDTFLSIKENMQRKEQALRKFIRAAVYTAMGEFIELLGGTKKAERLTKQDIFRIYDYKTAHYTFASPLAAGAILAGAGKKEVTRLYKYGIYLGRGFQIKDDILGMFGQKSQIGKSALTDLQQGKRTILIHYALNRLDNSEKSILKKTLAKRKIERHDLVIIRKLIKNCGALDQARTEITTLLQKAQQTIQASGIGKKYKILLEQYSRQILS